MWPRFVEMTLAGWLLVSPWIFTYAEPHWRLLDAGCGLAVLALALLSFRWRFAHLFTILPAAAWLLLIYSTTSYPPSADRESAVMVGFLLLMFAIIPSHATRPAAAWERFIASRQQDA